MPCFYAVGGELTLEAIGALNPVPNINNSFHVVTDSIAPNGDSLRTKKILIDSDPPNSLFINNLVRDRIRGIAWNEWAGYEAYPPHEHGYPQLNHYWPDTRDPCENAGGKDTGIMQIVRSGAVNWETWFGTPGRTPGDYISGPWDSLTWDWTINIFNGKYIHDSYNSRLIEKDAIQRTFPESCSYSQCGICPLSKNKEDLRTYGYHWGESRMSEVKTDNDWYRLIADPQSTWGKYVRDVRRYTYEKPWQ